MARRPKLKLAVAAVVGLILLVIIGALIVAYSGIYSVAASRGHPAWLNWFLETGMRRSVKTHSGGEKPPPLHDPALAALGAGHFYGGCAPCHGAPGEPVNPIFDHMLPAPPSLETHVAQWNDQDLFWIVKHGIQYAGMPAWSGENRDDEIWSVVAFLKTLPSLDENAYRTLAAGNASIDAESPGQILNAGRASLHLTACARCHDTPTAAPVSDLVPRLGGQPPEYLRRALLEYKDDRRQSGMMEPVAAELDDREINALAEFYAAMEGAPQSTQAVDKANALGARLAQRGDQEKGAPPCQTCHGADALPDYPRLAGQSARYIESQLLLWRRGGRMQSAHGSLMGEIARRLSDEQISAVAAYYAAADGEAP